MPVVTELDQWKERHALVAGGFEKLSEKNAKLRDALEGLMARMVREGIADSNVSNLEAMKAARSALDA